MDYLVLLVIVVLCGVLYLTLRNTNSFGSPSTHSVNVDTHNPIIKKVQVVNQPSIQAANKAANQPSIQASNQPSIQASNQAANQPSIQASCGGKTPFEYSGYNNYSTYATYYH